MLSLSVMLNKKQLSTIETMGEFGIYSDKPKLLKSNAGVCHVYWGELYNFYRYECRIKNIVKLLQYEKLQPYTYPV